MTSFALLSLLMLGLASVFIAVPLLRRDQPTVEPASASAPAPWVAMGLVAGVAVVAAGLYAALGHPAALTFKAESMADSAPPPAQVSPQVGEAPASNAMTQAQIEAMVNRLAQRLRAQPDDPDGWRMLARSYENLGRFAPAVQAYQHLLASRPPDADLLTDYAVTLGMSLNQTLVGEPEAVIDRALAINPQHIQALALSGSAAFERQSYGDAVRQWRKVLALIPPDADIRPSIERNIAKAETLARAR